VPTRRALQDLHRTVVHQEIRATDRKVVYQARRRETAETLAAAFPEQYGTLYPKAVASLARGLHGALTYTAFPSSHHCLIRTTYDVERVFGEVKRRTRVVGVFPSDKSAETLATAVLLPVHKDWAERRYLDMAPLHALLHKPTGLAT
jgi:transposase-like protein